LVSQGLNDTAALETRVAALETQLQRYKAAFDSISQGVCLFDSEQRVIVGNRPYAEIYGLSPDQIPPGTTLGEITEHRAAVGSCPMASRDYLAYVESINAKREDRDWSVRLDDGRTWCPTISGSRTSTAVSSSPIEQRRCGSASPRRRN
jgi:PAS domain-containing protein